MIGWLRGRRTADDWLRTRRFRGVEVIDPDGWRKPNMSWSDRVTRSEFESRLVESTCSFPKGFFKRT